MDNLAFRIASYRQISRVQLPGPNRDRNISIDLGDQNDVASISFVSNTASVYNVSVAGGRGSDMIMASTAGRLTALNAGGVLHNATLNIAMSGGDGNDSLDVRSYADLRFNTSVNVTQLGGAGRDGLIHEYGGKLENGSVNVLQDGGNGETVFDFPVFEPGSFGSYIANGVLKL
jgi:hypothetical protein